MSEHFAGQMQRPEWEQQFPEYMQAAFDRWRGGKRDGFAANPAAFEPQQEQGKRHDHLMALTERPREHGHLIITEYNNLGDLGASTPQEPPHRRQNVEIGGISEELTSDTRIISLWATHGGEFATFCAARWSPGEPLPDGIHWVPIAPKYEINRICHMPANLRIAYR